MRCPTHERERAVCDSAHRKARSELSTDETTGDLLLDSSEPSDIFEIQEAEMAATKLKLTELDALSEAAECLKTLAHPHRLRMVQMLLQGDFTVGELAEACELPTAMASEHLRLMQRCGFLNSTKDGRKVYYRVAEPHLKEILGCVERRFGGRSA
jgi:DNA-binding transcriptional ArsR family regulator